MNIAPSFASSFNVMEPGDPTAKFTPRTMSAPRFAVDTLAGRYIVFCFFGSAGTPQGRAAIDAMWKNRELFDDQRMSYFGVSVVPEDEKQGRLEEAMPGVRFMLDFDASVSRECGAVSNGNDPGQARVYRQFWAVIDPSLHVMTTFDFDQVGTEHETVFAYLRQLPPPENYAGLEVPAPVLILPHVFEPEFCRHLIDLYEADGGNETGVMRDNVGVIDRSMKSRKDFTVTDPVLIQRVQSRITRRIVPEIERVFFMKITRMERYMVGCYAAEDGGHFRPHRDNTQSVTAHRRFAVSINLNADFEGGEVSFPEYNRKGYKAPPGWAVVFPCNALHAVAKISKGRRYAFLPFVYDEAGAQIRQRNLQEMHAATPQNPTPVQMEEPRGIASQSGA